MESDEMELTREELQKFICDSVNHRLLHTPEVMNKQSQLVHLWDRKEKLCTDLYKLFESVSKCEVTVRQLYAKLGWEYKDLNTENCSDSASLCGFIMDNTDVGCASASSGFTANCLKTEQEEIRTEHKRKWPELTKEVRVLLERLPMDLRPRRPTCPKLLKLALSDDELSNGDSDYHPSQHSSDSDFSLSSKKSDQHKKKKFRKTEKIAKETPVQQTTPLQQQTTTVKPTTTVQPANIKSTNITNGNKPSANTNDALKNMSSGIAKVKKETKPFVVTEPIRPTSSLPLVLQEVCVGMQVLARRKRMRWESGTVADIVEKEDGTKKYKVTFEDKGKVLVSGHHIAYIAVPKLPHLSVGARVLSKCKSEHTFFSPGILGELPSRKNHMRFLIFFDDHRALYVALPVIRIICKPLSNPLDDIRDEEHKSFMKEYLQRMPYPPQTQFRLGQSIKVQLNGVMETCTVLQTDSSLMEVVFTKDDHKEWIYRGSIRLEHIINAKDNSNE
ncbi:histone-lysine N-methyltransferase SETDB1-A-like [Periophthalmus magnuspinnatus]|uniref:histone-lysine N-methyltransferase SETDB1-A-like n=1 Tax=Periophthalmus magnuspinnatus TaxID=409849 RepID=UPI00145A6541|nr:histone-lysine N-methyltransferase SETDB1-A-like [Periophthalmus magnuspinnatus]